MIEHSFKELNNASAQADTSLRLCQALGWQLWL